MSRRRSQKEYLPPEERGYRIRPYEPDDLKARLFTHTLPLLECYAKPHAPFHYLCIDDRKSKQRLRLVKVLYGPVLEVAYELESFNRKGAGILFYPSVIDGPTAKKEALRQFRSVWADVDCYKAAQEFDIELVTPTPTAVVKTPGGYHLHWILEKAIEANKVSIEEFELNLKRIQAALELMGADAGVCNINACMRLPGFYSHKAKTTLVELEAIYGGVNRYSADEIYVRDMQGTPVVAKKYSIDEILQHCPPLPPKPAKPYRPPIDKSSLPAKGRLERASKYLDKLPPAIEGQNGSRTTFITALKLLDVCQLTTEETCDLMLREYNPRCWPPWTEEEIEKKVRDAFNSLESKERSEGGTEPENSSR